MNMIDGNYQYRPRVLLRFDVHITEHCNLNCCNCNHYASIANEEFLDIGEYESDIERLSRVVDGEMEHINILGGEPFLNPNISKYIEITRKYFPVGRINIITNGTFIKQQDESFWKICRKAACEIWVTKYPLEIDYYEIFETIKKNGVIGGAFIGGGEDGRLLMSRYTLDPSGRQDIYDNYYHCFLANQCIQLKHGRLYPCVICANAHHLKKRFDLNIAISQRNSVDIYETEDADSVMERLASPIPFCRYCDWIRSGEYGDDWHITCNERYEWISFAFSQADFDYLNMVKRVYIYGAGNWGRKAYSRLREGLVQIKAFLVTNPDDNPSCIDGVPVLGIEDLEQEDEDAICLIAIAGIEKTKVQHNLYEKGFKRIIPIMKEP